MIEGTPKFTGLAVLEVVAEFKNEGARLQGKAAFIDVTTHVTYGYTKGEGAAWSRETFEKLNELRASMENDLAALHLVGGSARASTPSAPRSAEPGGLFEHLTEADQA